MVLPGVKIEIYQGLRNSGQTCVYFCRARIPAGRWEREHGVPDGRRGGIHNASDSADGTRAGCTIRSPPYGWDRQGPTRLIL